jgi:hypothetical protein
MAILCEPYPSERAARRAVEALRAAGVPGRDIRLLTGCRVHDVRREPVGGFAGTVGPDAPVGTFGDVRRLRCQATGTFAGDADGQRQGSFADTDRHAIVSYDGRAEHPRLVGDLELRRLLQGADLDAVPADRVVDELHLGHAAVVADVAEIAPSDARLRLKELANVA